MLRTIVFGLFFSSLVWRAPAFIRIGSVTENAAMKSTAFLLSGVMLLLAILAAVTIKTFEDRERKLLEGKDPDRQ